MMKARKLSSTKIMAARCEVGIKSSSSTSSVTASQTRGSIVKSFAHTCSGCSKPIKRDKFLLKACEKYWHENCLKCDRCHSRLGELGSTLYSKSNMILCRQDYLELFGETGVCSVCEKLICASEMVMRAKQNVYHLECFACQLCNQRFCVGDRFYLCENKVVCQYDYEEHILPIQKSLLEQTAEVTYKSTILDEPSESNQPGVLTNMDAYNCNGNHKLNQGKDSGKRSLEDTYKTDDASLLADESGSTESTEDVAKCADDRSEN